MNANRIKLIFVVSISLLFYSCSSALKKYERLQEKADRNFPQDYGVKNSIFDETFLQAIKITNIVANQPEKYLLVPDAVFYGSLKDQVKVPVYIVEKQLSSFCMVPPKMKTIIVNEGFADTLYRMFSANVILDSINLISNFTSELLAICLLHELGHIKNKDYEKNYQIDISNGINLDSSVSKSIEQEADNFAAFTLLSAQKDEKNLVRAIFAKNCLSALIAARYNLSILRENSLFKNKQSQAKNVWWDNNYTHVNTELRFFTIEHIASMSQRSGQGLDLFHKHRTQNNDSF